MPISMDQFGSFACEVGGISDAVRRVDLSYSAVRQQITECDSAPGAQRLILGRDGVSVAPVWQELFPLAAEHAS
ncbi:MAG: hypothetical protein AAFQ51_19480, partial [Pseudomonadota bacterium]